MAIVTLKNTPILIDLSQYSVSQGWSISNGTAYHDGCFGGYIKLKGINVEAGKSYTLTYKVSEYFSGEVYAIVGGVNGTPLTAVTVDDFAETFDVPEDSEDLTIQFFSDGTLAIQYFNIYPVLADPNNGNVISFNIDENKWVTYYSGERENMLKFVNDFFCFQNGRLFKMNSNPTRNYFFGRQYSSKITLVVNLNPTEIKNYYSLRMKTNKVWAVLDVEIPPSEGKENGQRSRIKSGNFKVLNSGDYFADFLRNSLDPRFDNELDALFKGSPLQGSYAIVQFECEATDEMRLLSIDFEISPQNLTY